MKVYGTDPWATDARVGYLRLLLFLLSLLTSSLRCTHHLRPRTGRLPRRHRVGGMAHRSARYVRDCGGVNKPAVHRVWLPPPRVVSRVDSTWGLAGSSLCWEPDTGDFYAQPGPGSC